MPSVAPPAATNRLRVLTLIDSFATFGGAERVAATITMRLDPTRFERFFCATRKMPGPTFEKDLLDAGVRVLALERESTAELSAWRRLVELLRRERIDIVHSHKFGANAWGVVLGRSTGVPVIVAHQHAGSYERQPLRPLVDRQVARWADAFLTVSRDSRRRMTDVEGIDPEKVRVVPNGIALPPATSGRDFRAELGIGARTPLVGTVSILRTEKALDVLVRSAALLTPEFPKLCVVIAGRGPEEARLKALASELGVEKTVRLLGPRTDVPEIIGALDVAVCCSDYEGSPLSVLEYMAAGKPVVATRVGGLPDMIEDGVHGMLVPRRDPAAIAEAVARLLHDASLRRQIGEAARKRQRREFHADVMVSYVESLYEELFRATARARSDRRMR